MQILTNKELITRWKSQPAPLLPLLHDIHTRDGYLSDEALHAVSEGLRIPIAELFGTVTFYHHFARKEGGRERPMVCTSPICSCRGANDLLEDLRARGMNPGVMPCPGRCDEPIPVLQGDTVMTGLMWNDLSVGPTPLPPARREGVEECVFRHIRSDGRRTLGGYRATGGYEALTKVLSSMSPEEVIQVIDDSGLTGRGGAGFPTGRKWRAVLEAPGDPKTVVCNADEGEPGCFKDRTLMDYDPHGLIEGMIIGAYATGSSRAFIYLRYEYPETEGVLEHALEEARAANLLGPSILGSDFSFELYVRRGAGAYICGEESSLLNSLEGKHPFPRNRPPFPVTHGYEDLPTAVNNVETLSSIAPILAYGADWYRNLGDEGHAGTKVISLSGDIRRPGNYEVPLGTPLLEVLNVWAGGPLEGRQFQAVTMAGLSGGFLGIQQMDVTLDEPSIRGYGSFLGAGGIMVFDDTRDILTVAREAMEFFADESCGKCFPCRIGTKRLVERLEGKGPTDLTEWVDEVSDLNETMKQTSACGLGQAAPLITESLLKYFPDRVRAHVNFDGSAGIGANDE